MGNQGLIRSNRKLRRHSTRWLACGEGYSREDGRSHIFPVRGMEYMVIKNPTAGFYHVLHNPEVNPAISRSEMPDNEIWEVRSDNSSDELFVLEMDAKFRTVVQTLFIGQPTYHC